jgi:hypothetical protein
LPAWSRQSPFYIAVLHPMVTSRYGPLVRQEVPPSPRPSRRHYRRSDHIAPITSEPLA